MIATTASMQILVVVAIVAALAIAIFGGSHQH
ncbi:hypothetical protein SAMN05892883_1389 [Jatrophihabitans sp. GAS493]|nr:hypothetical protein SAMN05892883_1389 [Jatrophihabitans sp. GAS493]